MTVGASLPSSSLSSLFGSLFVPVRYKLYCTRVPTVLYRVALLVRVWVEAQVWALAFLVKMSGQFKCLEA